MKELAAAIAAKIPAADGTGAAASASVSSAANAAPAMARSAVAGTDAVTDRLSKLTEGLFFMSESDAPLTSVSLDASAGDLTNEELLKLVGEPAGTPVETQELTLFLRNHTADKGILNDVALANRFKALQMFMKQELQDTKVYRIGNGPTIQAYALGRTDDGKLAGFKTALTET
jgi:histidine triad (HIT) family protein